MNTKTGFLSTGVITILLSLTACSGSGVKDAPSDCVFPDSPNDKAPGWICNEPVDGVAVWAVGAAEKSAAGHNFMKNMASTAARIQLAQSMKVHVQNRVKQYAETMGLTDTETVNKVNTSVTKQITDEALVGTKVFKARTSPNGTLYVLLGMDSSVAAITTENALKSSMNKDDVLWQQFKTQNEQDELASSIANMK